MDGEAGPSGVNKAKFECNLCGKSYKYKKGLTAHVKQAHQATPGWFDHLWFSFKIVLNIKELYFVSPSLFICDNICWSYSLTLGRL